MAGELEHVRKALRELDKSLKSLPGDPPPKDVHKLRTATRRVEAIAGALAASDGKKSRRLLKSIAPVRKAAGGVRDMDVLTANARKLRRYVAGDSLARLLDILESARRQNAAELDHAIVRRRKSAQQNLKQYTRVAKEVLGKPDSAATFNGRPHDDLQAAAARLARELGAWLPLEESNIHEFRLKVKELRYTLQLYAEADSAFVDALGEVQRRIGDWHDWHELSEIAHEMLHPEQDRTLVARIDQTAKRRFDRALSSANALRGKYLTAPFVQGI